MDKKGVVFSFGSGIMERWNDLKSSLDVTKDVMPFADLKERYKVIIKVIIKVYTWT